MPYYSKSEDWLHHSSLLLAARPTTTRISTNYHLSPARRTPKDATPEQIAEDEKKGKRGHLVITTFDPKSGASLKYKTSKAQEVGRLVQMLGNLAGRAAGVVAEEGTKKDEDVEMAEVGGEKREGGEGSGVATPVVQQQQQQQPQQGGGGGGKGKKKKGKR
ncbi:signal recognition particle 9 kDa protein-domain-containing protein [Cercophora samala]|uniref:Signal recognition particle 9 kDa protein-domain-containing protein n=1 Tax=Cercophora samala TaxID=330535 RepID=A0AA40DEE6_9PEZI|nr:signal recognition particle 9 kDa protein-domain-containing protein [Cercophora samala]